MQKTFELYTKAAVAPGTTSDATWAGPLATYGVASELLQLIRGRSILGALDSRFRRVPFRTKVARETGTGTGGAWIGEGLSTPAAATAYDTLSQEAYKAGKIVVLSDELRRLGDPDAERSVRETVADGVGAFLDGQLLTNTVTLSANLRPAAITNGAPVVVSTGSTQSQIMADLNSLIAAITTGGGGLVWVTRPLTAARIAATLGANAPDMPRTLFGIPLVLSENSPQQVTLIDAPRILYSDTGGIDIDASDDATIQFDDAPTDPAVSTTVFRSLWQNDLWGVRVTRWLAYLRAQTRGQLHGRHLLRRCQWSRGERSHHGIPASPKLTAGGPNGWRRTKQSSATIQTRIVEAQRAWHTRVINARADELRAALQDRLARTPRS